MGEKIRSELRKFAETTAIKGVSRAVKAQSSVIRVFWVLALTACFAVMLYQIVNVIISFCKYDVISTSRTVETVDPNFPAVTICNLFPVPDFDSVQDRYKTFLQQIQFVRDHSPPRFKNNSELWNYLQLLLSFNTNIPVSSLLSWKQLDSFILRCNAYGWDLYNGKRCNQELTLVRPLQVCQTILSGRNVSAILAILFIDTFVIQPINSYYIWPRAPLSTGISVMIHPKGTKPNPDDAISVPPGTDFKIKVTQTNITRMPSPYGNCTDRKLIFPDEPDSLPYDQATCISLCRQRQYVQKCGCLDNFEYFTNAELKLSDRCFCLNVSQAFEFISSEDLLNYTFAEELDCVWNFEPKNELCDCPLPCSDLQYEVNTYGTQWPNVVYQLGFYDAYLRQDNRYNKKFSVYEEIWNDRSNRSADEILEQLLKTKLIEQNFVQLTVQLSQKRVNMVKEIEAISWTTMASNLGGALNLWLGLSIVTLAELLELLYSIARVVIGDLYRRKHPIQVKPVVA